MDLRAALNAVDDDYDDDVRPIPTEPMNNKIKRLVHFDPHRQISDGAIIRAEEKREVFLGSNVTTTMALEHNDVVSNAGRNTETFQLKRDLLHEYSASVQDDDREAAMFDALIDRSAHPARQSTWVCNTSHVNHLEKKSVSLALSRGQQPLPKYKPVEEGEADLMPLTGDKPGSLTLDERVKYVSSLWPSLAPVDDDEEIMNYYGIEVNIISEEEREKELAAETEQGESSSILKEGEVSLAATTTVIEVAPIHAGIDTKADGDGDSSSSEATTPSTSELSMKTRSAALQKLKEAAVEDDDEIRPNPIATKQDDWVQCDKCQKWRRLPNQVNVSELPATWYCKKNRWDKRHNKCSAPEEKLMVLMKGADLADYRQRKFVQDFIQRCKRLDKSTHHYKYTHSHADDGERKFVQCSECLKLRPLIGGMDPNKVAEPFACWMNWDELLASCSAPEGPLYPRTKPERYTSAYASFNVVGDDVKIKKGIDTVSSSAASGVSCRGGNKPGRKGKRKNGTFEKGTNATKAGMKKVKRRTAHTTNC